MIGRLATAADAEAIVEVWNTCVAAGVIAPASTAAEMADKIAGFSAVPIVRNEHDVVVAAAFVQLFPDGGPAAVGLIVVHQALAREARRAAYRAVCAAALRFMRGAGVLECIGAFHVPAAARLTDEFGGTLARIESPAGFTLMRFDTVRCLATLECAGY